MTACRQLGGQPSPFLLDGENKSSCQCVLTAQLDKSELNFLPPPLQMHYRSLFSQVFSISSYSVLTTKSSFTYHACNFRRKLKRKKQGRWVTFVLHPAFPCFRCWTKACVHGYRQATDEMWDATVAVTFTFWTELDKPTLQVCFISFTSHFHGCWYNNVWISILVNCIVNTQYYLCMYALAMEEQSHFRIVLQHIFRLHFNTCHSKICHQDLLTIKIK